MIAIQSKVGPVERYMVEEQVRMQRLLTLSTEADTIDRIAFARFRRALLRHAAMVEKVLLPYVRSKRLGIPLPLSSPLRIDHAQLVKLLGEPPTRELVDDLRLLLDRHAILEEGAAGLYAQCDALAGNTGDQLVARLRALPADLGERSGAVRAGLYI